jgi:N-acetylneuraminic acid mutarotase
MKIGDKIYEFEIILDFKKNEVRQKKEEHSIIGINKDRLVMNDEQFTTLELKKTRYNDHQTIIRTVGVYHSNFSIYYDEVKAYFHTTNPSEKIAKKIMKKKIESFMWEKFGRYTAQTHLLDKI